MDRREAIKKVALIMGGTVLGAELFMQMGCNPSPEKVNNLFDQDQLLLLDEIAETILPQTSTPGAKAAKVGAFMTAMVQDCYIPEDQEVFMKGLSDLDKSFDKKYGSSFLEGDSRSRTEFLKTLDEEQKKYAKEKKPEDPNHYFSMMKQLTLLGYFTSEVGATKALRYLPIPGRYDGCMDYKKGDRAWAI
ncbi:gluconate 2-dehydrogenase subunit 3 family protein [Arcticibacter eurypsychrophilus]|uniref:gluconate 2-dehydrogenase subunit 3 family protein n=1 Tax=Arcticibacter eurypsychrophilus TaxID=1434752 RepID=UPI00084DA9FF|nr:gluconate 2-dehydrogenase subunit 3 family protein [Arcticibacter eurypsychrophilus]